MLGKRKLNNGAAALTNFPSLFGAGAKAESHFRPMQVAVPSNAWAIRNDMSRLDITSAGLFPYTGAAWRSDSKRLVVTTIGYAAVYDAYSGTEVLRLRRGGEGSKNGSIRYLDRTNVIIRGGTLFGQPKVSNIALTLVDGDTAVIVRQVGGYSSKRPVRNTA